MIALILFTFSLPAVAQERAGDLAVMEMSFSGQGLTKKQIEFISDDIREKAVVLTQFRIMTKENIFAILQDKKVDLSKCADTECEVQFGRILQADKLITSGLLFSEDTYFLKIKFYDVPSASIEKQVSRECKTCDFSKLRKTVRDAAQEILGGVVTTPEKKEEAPVSAGQGVLKETADELQSNVAVTPEEKNEEAPASSGQGELQIETKPTWAKVFFDGVQKGQTAVGQPLILSELRSGSHKVRIENPDYEIAERDVEVAPGVQGKIEITLLPKFGILTVAATPVKANVIINKQEMGKTPYTVKLQPGEYMVEVIAEGYTPQEKMVLVQSNCSLMIPFSLENGGDISQSSQPGVLVVTSTPVKAEVTINDQKMGETPYKETLQSGEYIVKVTANGFTPQEKKILVQSDCSLMLPFSLENESSKPKDGSALPPEPGILTITATPVKSEVTINGRKMGETPYAVRLRSGEYIVKVTAKGYKTQEKRILIQSDRSLTLPFSLEK
jgi:hypothetical protein